MVKSWIHHAEGFTTGAPRILVAILVPILVAAQPLMAGRGGAKPADRIHWEWQVLCTAINGKIVIVVGINEINRVVGMIMVSNDIVLRCTEYQ